jgi:DNA-binding protein HU-beta
MNKTALIELIAEHQDVGSKAAAKRILDATFDALGEAIVNGGASISGIGTFHVVDRDARTGRNPQTGAEIQIPAKRVPKFRPSTKLKEAVNA